MSAWGGGGILHQVSGGGGSHFIWSFGMLHLLGCRMIEISQP